MTTFAVQRGYSGREAIAVRSSASHLGMEAVCRDYPLKGEIPVGSVEFCQEAFGPHNKVFYPHFLQDWFYRAIYRVMGGGLIKHPMFVKDATAWKSEFPSGVLSAGFVLDEGDWWLSDAVRFEQEWRYYVACGDVVTSGWYMGEDSEEPAPELDVPWPEGFSGAVDFGRLATGELALVEAHAPFACGWYGDVHMDYARWLEVAWKNAGWWKSLEETSMEE